jgi:hypothetical protein
MIAARLLRWSGAAIAVAAIVDPRISLPRRERPGVRLLAAGDAAPLRDRLDRAGFARVPDGEAATVAALDAAAAMADGGSSPTPLFVLTERRGPDVSILRASAPDVRVAGQGVTVSITLHAQGGRGTTTRLVLEDAGLAVASTSHQWRADEETWQATLTYLPDGVEARRLRVRAGALPGEQRLADNVADVLAPALRGPIRTLALASDLTWPGVFVRRALEAAPAFAVSSAQHSTKITVVRAGSPPPALTRDDLAPYETLILGNPDGLDAPSRDAVRWFVEARGGVAVVVPDRLSRPAARDWLTGVSFDSKIFDTPVALGGSGEGLMAAEVAVPQSLPPLASVLASSPTGAPVIFTMRRGMGAVIVSGALDAWRYRDRREGAFARFWQSAVVSQAAAVPPRLEVTVAPRVARPGDVVHLTAQLRSTELPSDSEQIALPLAEARALSVSSAGPGRDNPGNYAQAQLPAVSPDGAVAEPVRLWPGTAPGVFEGEWRATANGTYALDVTVGGLTALAVVNVAADAAGAPVNEEAVAIAARASGGGTFASEGALVRVLQDRFPAVTVMRPTHPARSPWWAAALAVMLCGEWALRRRRGLP